ncbi:hypothetical protein BH09PSE5_BH09PSE5_41030 [soil metagenome]
MTSPWSRIEAAYQIAIAVALILTAVILHAPWTGYTTQTVPPQVDTMTLLSSCPDLGRAAGAEVDHAELLRRFDKNLACTTALKPKPVPIRITRWRSNSPLVESFGRLRNVTAGIVFVAVAAGLIGWSIRRGRRPRQ